MEFIIEGVNYLFEDNVNKRDIEAYVKKLPITINKQLIKKEPLDITSLDEELQNAILSSPLTPIDFLLPSVVTDYPTNIVIIQKNEKMLAVGKEIRKRNFSKKLIERLSRLDSYFAIFLYESRKHPIWRAVLDSVIKAPFTPERLLQYLDTLFRRDATEYMNFYSLLGQNTKLTRVIYLIDALKEEENQTKNETGSVETEQESEEIMSISKLNHYAHHWFPGIVLASVKRTLAYKTTIERVYDELQTWNNRHEFSVFFEKYPFYANEPDNPQKINPMHNQIVVALVRHPKVSGKILQLEMNNQDVTIRKLVILSPNVTITIVNKLQHDSDPIIRKIALFTLHLMKTEKEYLKYSSTERDGEGKNTRAILNPLDITSSFKEQSVTRYL